MEPTVWICSLVTVVKPEKLWIYIDRVILIKQSKDRSIKLRH